MVDMAAVFGQNQLLLMLTLKSQRQALRVSQIRLGHLAKVSRFRICLFEHGDGYLTLDEQRRIIAALQAEAERLGHVPIQIEFDQPDVPGSRPLPTESENDYAEAA